MIIESIQRKNVNLKVYCILVVTEKEIFQNLTLNLKITILILRDFLLITRDIKRYQP